MKWGSPTAGRLSRTLPWRRAAIPTDEESSGDGDRAFQTFALCFSEKVWSTDYALVRIGSRIECRTDPKGGSATGQSFYFDAHQSVHPQLCRGGPSWHGHRQRAPTLLRDNGRPIGEFGHPTDESLGMKVRAQAGTR